MTLAPVDNISFDEPGNLYFGGSPGFTFNLTNYSLSVGAGVAPCSLEPFAPTPSVGRIHCSTNPAARGGGNPYFSIHYDQSIGAPVLQVAYPDATGSIRACGNFATNEWGALGMPFMSLQSCGAFPAGYDPITIQVVPVNATQS
ncbi:hypothetical protein EG329_013937 [Mollisiaceae sp. DMI_Dod_QoI]|nr:hypothetical protein EG329_013937 [Helotiales sp. DMI_Dod_QoI]